MCKGVIIVVVKLNLILQFKKKYFKIFYTFTTLDQYHVNCELIGSYDIQQLITVSKLQLAVVIDVRICDLQITLINFLKYKLL